MIRVKEGDLDQLGLLFERYHRLLFSFFYYRSKNAALSEDLVQNVFMRILKYRHNFRGEGEFKSWLFHIARNVHYDYHRKRRIPPADQAEEWEDRIRDESDSPYEKIIHREEMDQLKAALQQLEAEKREVIVLAKLKGMPYKDIGRLLGCSEGAVKVRVFRALKALKEICEKQDYE
jgi:RNA polymerase sigma factor (sigma-70 family)